MPEAPTKITLTAAYIDRLSPAPKSKERQLHYDVKVPGLALQITPTGKKSFVLYKKCFGRPVKRKLGDYPYLSLDDARKAALTILAELLRPECIKKTGKQITYGVLFEKYISLYAQHKCKGWEEYKRNHTRYFSEFDNIPCNRITRDSVQSWLNNLGFTKGAATANRQFNQFRAVMNWGKNREHVFLGSDPCADIDKFDEEPRERYLTMEEWKRLKAAIDLYPDETVKDALWMLALTGQRKSVVLAMEWKEIALEEALWMIPARKQKNRKLLHLPLSVQAIAILEKRKKTSESRWVFPGTGKTGHLVAITKAWYAIIKNAGIEDLHIHDLRHTFASRLAEAEVSLQIIQKAMGHSSIQSTLRYAHRTQKTIRYAVNKINRGMVKSPGSPNYIAKVSKIKTG